MLKSILVVVLLGISGILSSPMLNKKLMWWPKDDGTGVVPAFLESDPTARPIIKAPYDNIRFFLFTQTTQNAQYELLIGDHDRLSASSFDMSAPVKILAHGFTQSHNMGFSLHMKNAFLNSRHVNLITVEWGLLAAAPWYDVAAGHTRLVGEKTAELIRFLLDEGVSMSQIHMIGHSLGSHVSGFCGAALNSELTRITALDPALPLFGNKNDTERIDPTDAVFIDVIHTAGGGLLEGGLAFREPRGHADFYPNEGEHQPGCGADVAGTCSHFRAYEYYGESIANEQGFSSCKCKDWEDFLGACACTETEFMGEACSSSTRGLFFLHTNSQAPFAQG